mgnify:CR=1 FL=1
MFAVNSLSNELAEEYIETKISNVVSLYIHGLYIGGSNKQVNVVIFKLFFLTMSYSQFFMSLNIRHRNCDSWFCSCVYWSEMLCAQLYIVQVHVKRDVRLYEA